MRAEWHDCLWVSGFLPASGPLFAVRVRLRDHCYLCWEERKRRVAAAAVSSASTMNLNKNIDINMEKNDMLTTPFLLYSFLTRSDDNLKDVSRQIEAKIWNQTGENRSSHVLSTVNCDLSLCPRHWLVTRACLSSLAVLFLFSLLISWCCLSFTRTTYMRFFPLLFFLDRKRVV